MKYNSLTSWKTRKQMPTDYPFDPELEKEERVESEEEDSEQIPPADVISFNELRSCSDLVRMVDKGQLEIDPDFQRSFIWGPADQARFIDSLMKGLPIPSICMSYDYNANKRLIIDGRQRIQTIIDFLTGSTYRLSALPDIDDKISGKTVAEIKKNDRTLYDRVENLAIPVTVIRCDNENPSHMRYLFKIFHRLNSGGIKLNNQEIRNCIFIGLFNSFLKETVLSKEYRSLMNIDDAIEYRFLFEELNLRFFALHDVGNKYPGKLASFMNDYMHSKVAMERKGKTDELVEEIEKKKILLEKAVSIIYEKIFDNRHIEKLSKAHLEALFIAVFENIDVLAEENADVVKVYYKKLKDADEFKTEKLKENLSQKNRVVARIEKAIQIFSGK